MLRKKYIVLVSIILTVLCLFSFTSCQNRQNNEKESLFNEPDTSSLESDPEAMKNYNYGKTFAGGTGFVKEENKSPYYEYTGGSMKIEYVIENGGDAFECGVSLVLDGINQTFTLTDKKGKTTDNGLMHIINLGEKESVTLTLEFTPNTGKKGDILNVAVGTMLAPSYTTVYNGYGSYGKYRQHAFNAGSDVDIHMMTDAPTQEPSAKLTVEQVDIPEAYRELFRSEDGDRWGTEYKIELYSDQKIAEAQEKHRVIRVPAGDTAEITLDVFGMAADWRASLFVNHELIELTDGCTYIDFSTDTKSVTRVTLPVDISELSENNHAYVILYQKSENSPNMSNDTYLFADKIDTYYFIVGGTDATN